MRGALAIVVGLAVTACGEARSHAPTGVALAGDGTAIVAWVEYDGCPGGATSTPQVSTIDLSTGTIATRALDGLGATAVATGGQTQLAFDGFAVNPSLQPHPLRAQLLVAGVPIGRARPIAEAAVATSVAFDGAAYQIVWLEPAGDQLALRIRTLGEDGTLADTCDLGVAITPSPGQTAYPLSISPLVVARPFDATRIAIAVGELPDAVHVVFAAGGAAEGAPITVASLRAPCLLGAETLPDATGAPVFRVFACTTASPPTVDAIELAPTTAPHQVTIGSPMFGAGWVDSFDSIGGVAPDEIVLLARHSLAGHFLGFRVKADYSTVESFMLPDEDFTFHRWVRWARGFGDWVVPVAPDGTAVELETFTGDAAPTRLPIANETDTCSNNNGDT